MLQHRGLNLDVQLLARLFSHAVQRMAATGARLPVVRQIVFDARARQVGRQRFAAALAVRRLVEGRQSGLGQGERCVGLLIGIRGGGDVLGFVEDAVGQLLALRREAFQLYQAELFFEQGNALGQRGNLLFCLGDLLRRFGGARLQFTDIGLCGRRQLQEVVFVHAVHDSGCATRMGLRKIVTRRWIVASRPQVQQACR